MKYSIWFNFMIDTLIGVIRKTAQCYHFQQFIHDYGVGCFVPDHFYCNYFNYSGPVHRTCRKSMTKKEKIQKKISFIDALEREFLKNFKSASCSNK